MATNDDCNRLSGLPGLLGSSSKSMSTLADMAAQYKLLSQVSPATQLAKEMGRQQTLANREQLEAMSKLAGLSTIKSVIADQVAERQRVLRDVFPQIGDVAAQFGLIAAHQFGSVMDAATRIEAIRAAGGLHLSEELNRYRQSNAALAYQLDVARRKRWWNDNYLEALNSNAALANLFDASRFIGQGQLAAARSAPDAALFRVKSIREARELLDLSRLLRAPRARVLTSREKRQRIRRNVRENTPTKEVRKAHSLIHAYELVIRDVLVSCLERRYGADWAHERLPVCDGCKTLLGRPRAEDETVLDQADFPHYGAIIANPQHFDEIFSMGFESPDLVLSLFSDVRELRKRSHHARTFTPEHLRHLTLTLRAIESGLAELIDDFVSDADTDEIP